MTQSTLWRRRCCCPWATSFSHEVCSFHAKNRIKPFEESVDILAKIRDVLTLKTAQNGDLNQGLSSIQTFVRPYKRNDSCPRYSQVDSTVEPVAWRALHHSRVGFAISSLLLSKTLNKTVDIITVIYKNDSPLCPGYTMSVRRMVVDRNRPVRTIVLLTRMASRGAIDLYPSWGISCGYRARSNGSTIYC